MKKRILSILLTLCMVLTLLPTTVFAAGSGNKNIMLGTSQIEGGQASSVYFGNYQQSSDGSGSYNADPVKWRVLANDENSSGKLFLLAGQNLDVKPYNSSYTSITWEKSTIRSWLNGYGANENNYGTDYSSDNFIDTAFSSNEQSAIVETYIYNTTQSDGSSNPNPSYSTSGGNNTTDKIFLLSIEEANNNSYFPNGNDSRKSTNTAYVASYSNMYGVGVADYWWLRSPGHADYDAAYVRPSGGFTYGGARVDDTEIAVRPAFNLNLNSVLFTSAAEGGKADTAVDGDLTAVSDYTGSEWKLTLLDSSRDSFSISGATVNNGTIRFSYSGAQTGTNEYISAVVVESGTITHYGRIFQLDGTTYGANGTASLSLPAGVTLSENTKLYVFNEQYNGDYQTDYASALKVVLPQEATPSATFTATGDNGGTLSNVDTTMKYSVDGGTTWIAITGEPMAITGVTAANDVKVYKPGNGTTTADSEVQTIDVTQAAQPAGVDKADCTTPQQNDGQITGVETTMEYRLSGASDWTAVTGNPVTGLGSGSYEVRVKASGTVLASGTVIVTIGAHTCVAQGDWQHDGTSHWKLCACGAKVEEAAHSGGTATCTAKAVCAVCDQPYGETDNTNHNLENIPAKPATVTETGNIEYWHCTDCGKYFSDENGENEIKLDDTVIAKLPPEIIEGKGQSVTEGEKKELSFTSNAAFSDFIRVELDGKTLDEKNYTVKEGSTVVTLKADYVATLSVGEHTIGIVSESGTATTTFTVNAKAVVDNDINSPQTGDSSHMAFWIALLFVSGAGVIGITVYGKKKRAK